MDLNSRLFDRIRVSPRCDEPQPDAAARACAHPACQALGEYRAPQGRGREGQYFWFCLDHVKAYNATYNYFNGMSDDAVAAYQKADLYGQRPTWRLGVNAAAAGRVWPDDRGQPTDDPRAGVDDPLGLFGWANGRAPRQQDAERKPQISVAATRALETLGLEPGVEPAAIKARYKELVKRLHPDANGGDRSREERLRAIINAYNHLRQAKIA